MSRRLAAPVKAFFTLLMISLVAFYPNRTSADYRTFGLLGGLSFPKGIFAELDLNFAEHWAIDYIPSLSVFWSIQQLDVIYYFSRSEWSPYIGVGAQNWNFYGFSSSTNYNGVIFGAGNSATAATIPLGLMYMADNGFAVNLRLAADIFVSAPLDLKGIVIPEGELSLGFFF